MKIKLIDGTIKEFEKDLSIIEITQKIGISLSKKFLAALVDGKYSNIYTLQNKDFELKLILDEKEALEALNISTANIFSRFLLEKNIAINIEESKDNESGFYVEFSSKENFSETKLDELEEEFNKYIKNNENYDENTFIKKGSIYKVKFNGVSGIESGGNRIFGYSAFSKKQFDEITNEIKENHERDHRRIGKKMELFFFNKNAKGLPFWLPNGVKLKRTMQEFIMKQEEKFGFTRIETPLLGSIDLYKASGHYQHYKDNMYPEMEIEKDEFVFLRPMACPHHCQVFKYKPRSYKDLPLRFSEEVMQFRYEASGALLGLERVRGMQLTDAHIFLREDQLEEEVKNAYEIIVDTLKAFKIEIHHIELAMHDPNDFDKYHGDKELWKNSEKSLENFLVNNKIEFEAMRGEAAFYGPKIDIQIRTSLGHIVTISTIQLDYLLPEKFDLNYINHNGEKEKPIMIHRGLVGTYERFISVLIEQTKGDFPMWLAPRQAVIIPINNNYHLDYSNKILDILKKNDVRVELDSSDERLSNKIRKYQTEKVKTQIIIGDNEIKENNVSIRFYGDEKTKTISLEELLNIYNDKEC